MTDRPEINSLLEHYGSRTKDRRSYMTNCVLHEDRTPSLSINTDDQLFNCKSCGAKGDSFHLIMLKEGITDFRRAVEFAATLGLATRATGGGDGAVRGRAYVSRRGAAGQAATRPGDRPSNGDYVPRWRRS